MSGDVRVLFVEDNALLAEAIAEFLKSSGLEVSIAETGTDALHQARSFRPDIIVSDLSLPDMSGLDLLRTLRSSAEAKDAVLAVHTAMGEFDLRMIERESDVQIDVFMTKPLTPQKLSRLLEELRHKRHTPPY